MKSKSSSQIPKILILSSADSRSTMLVYESYIADLNARLKGKCEVEWVNYHNVGLDIKKGSLKAFIVSPYKELNDYKAVYIKSYFRFKDVSTAIAEALDDQNIPYVGSEMKNYIADQKLNQLARLSRANLPIPHTLYMPSERYLENYNKLVKDLGSPFIFKAESGSSGDDNYLIRSKDELAKVLDSSANIAFVAQTYIPNTSDMRFLILNDEVKLVIERERKDDSTHLNNTSKGSTARLIDPKSLAPSLKALALKAAHIMDRDKGGVDIMLETGTTKPYILEVNASPQIASGSFMAEKLDVYVEFFESLAKL